jgi:tripartite-type tricarboxylate transporter receptor subunit TctC
MHPAVALIILRIMAKIIQSRRDLAVPITVVNKPGGGGAYRMLI